jgi:hypothetical protein
MSGKDWLIGQGLFIPNQNRQIAKNIPSHSHFADNLIVFLISNLGVVGSLLFLLLVTNSLKHSKKENLFLISSLVTHAMFNNGITQSFVVLIFLGLFLAED